MSKEIKYVIREQVKEYCDGTLVTEYYAMYKMPGWFKSWKYVLQEYSSEKIYFAGEVPAIQAEINRHRKRNTPPTVTTRTFTEDGRTVIQGHEE